MKNYSDWFKVKNKLDQNSKKFYHEREVWWCYFGCNVGSEQNGGGRYFERPILILRGISKDVFVSLALSTVSKESNHYIDIGRIGGVQSYAIISQIRLIDTRRLSNKICRIDKETFELIAKSTKDLIFPSGF